MDQITELLIKLLRAEIDEEYVLSELSLSSQSMAKTLPPTANILSVRSADCFHT